jgi:hypothetical protein
LAIFSLKSHRELNLSFPRTMASTSGSLWVKQRLAATSTPDGASAAAAPMLGLSIRSSR